MTQQPTQPSRRTMAHFGDDDDLPVPTPEQRAQAHQAGQGLGFHSEKSTPAQTAEPISRPTRKMRERVFTDAIHVRAKPEDRVRFEDFAYRNRISKGDAMSLILDMAEAEERRRANVDS